MTRAIVAVARAVAVAVARAVAVAVATAVAVAVARAVTVAVARAVTVTVAVARAVAVAVARAVTVAVARAVAVAAALAPVLALAACGPTVTATSPALANARAPGSELEREIARRLELDYRSPMRERWLDEEPPRDYALFRTLCETGDPSACLRAEREYHKPTGFISMYCSHGDELSCRYDTWYHAAYGAPYPFRLSTAELRRGCAAGLAAECQILVETGGRADARFAAETGCRYERRDCVRAAESYLAEAPRDPLRARFLLELDCQSRGLNACSRLSVAYRRHELAEPVWGRGLALHRYLCPQRFVNYCTGADADCNARWKALLAPGACEQTSAAPATLWSRGR